MAKLFLKKLSLMVVFGFLALFVTGFICTVFGFTENLATGNYLPYIIVLAVCAVALFITICVLRVHDSSSKTAYMVSTGSVKLPIIKRIRYILRSRDLWAELTAEGAMALVLTLYVAFTTEGVYGPAIVLGVFATFLLLTVPFFIIDVLSWLIVHSIWMRYLKFDDAEKAD